jgi:hypothetical protein
VSHDRFGDRRDHFRDFRRDDSYGTYTCEFGNSPIRYCE